MTLKKLVETKRVKLLREADGGVYYVPKVMVRRMEVKKKSYMEATVVDKSIKIKPVGTYGKKKVQLVYVDARGNLRIPSSLVIKARGAYQPGPFGYSDEVLAIQERVNEITLI
jgi:hypothetical protein